MPLGDVAEEWGDSMVAWRDVVEDGVMTILRLGPHPFMAKACVDAKTSAIQAPVRKIMASMMD